MKESEINIAIAEACGFEVIKCPFVPNKVDAHGENVYFTNESAAEWYRTYPSSAFVSIIHNYCGDLNAMHEAEKIIKHDATEPTRWNIYCDHLAESCESITQAVGATAQQRAEAFLKVITNHQENKKERG